MRKKCEGYAARMGKVINAWNNFVGEENRRKDTTWQTG
jgi:hypothetical protein